MSGPSRDHPSPEQLPAFGLGLLSAEESAAVARHVAECDACCQSLLTVADDALMSRLRQAASTADDSLPPAEAPTRGLSAPGPAAPPEPLPPELADHPRYQVEALLGAGGMGAVYRAHHRVMGRPVALKVISHALTNKPAAVERFAREGRAAARLKRPNIVTAFDAEQAGGTHFLVMEYVEGTDLARLVAEQGPLPVDRACEYVRQAALGLQHAFEQGMVHRDVKPHNLMLTPDGQVKILDFGLARFATEAASEMGLTGTGTVLGTVDYIAPEQADNAHQADVRADIYSLGCTLYHLLAGRPPFPTGTPVQRVMAHVEKTPQPLAELRPDVPEELMPVLERMMAKSPAARYQTPAEVAAALRPFIDPAALRGLRKAAPIARPAPRRRRFRPLVAAALALLLLGGGLLGVAVYRIATDKGELVIRSDSADVEVVVSKGGEVVKIIDTRSGKHVTLRPGDYELALKDRPEGLKLSADKVTLRRGEKVLATIERVAARPAPKPPDGKAGEVRRFEGHRGGIIGISYAPDGRHVLSASYDRTVRLWDVASGKEVRRFEGHTAWPYTAVLSPDGRHVLSGGDDFVLRVWDARTGKQLRQCGGHTRGIICIAVSPDSRRALTGGWDGTVRLWDVETGKELRRLGHTEIVQRVDFSPDGKRALSAGGDKTVRLWDLETGKELRRLEGHTAKVTNAAFSPDGSRCLSGSMDRTVRLWDVGTGQQVRCLEGHTSPVWQVAFTPDGRRAISAASPEGDKAGERGLRGWDLETGKELYRLDTGVSGAVVSPDGRYALVSFYGHPDPRLWRLPDPPPAEKVGEVRRFQGHKLGIIQVALSRDGRLALSGSADQTARLWEVATGKELQRFEGHNSHVLAVAFSPDGRQALTGGEDNRLRLWDVTSGKELRSFEGHTGYVMGVAFSPDGRRCLSGSMDHTPRLWDVATGKELRRFEGHTELVGCVAFSPDGGRAVSGGADHTVRLWDVATGKELRKFEGHTALVRAVAYSPDGRRVLSGERDGAGTLRLWDVETGRELRKMLGIPDGIHGVAFSPDGRRALAAGNDADVQLWDLETGQLLCRLKGHTAPPFGVASAVSNAVFSPDGRYALSGGGDETLRLWRLPDAPAPEKVGQVHVFQGHKDIVHGIAVSRDGHYAVSGAGYKYREGKWVEGAKDYDVRLWDLATRTELRRLSGTGAAVWSVAISPDGLQILSGGGGPTGAVRLLDAATGQELKRWEGRKSAVWSVAFSPDGRRALDAADYENEFRLRDVASGKEVRRFAGHTKQVRRAVFSPDGRHALSCSWDGTTRLWDVETAKELKRFEGHNGFVAGAAMSPDGRRVLTGGNDRTLRLWDVETGKEVKRFEGHKAMVTSVAFSPDGRFALSASGDTGASDEEDFSLRLWDLKSGKELHRFEGHTDVVEQVLWLPDGRHALSCSWDTTVRLWRLPDLPAAGKR